MGDDREHPAEQPSSRKYFRSLGELDDTPEFRDWVAREFPQGAAMMADEADAGQSRRDFMKLMGAATSMAGSWRIAAGPVVCSASSAMAQSSRPGAAASAAPRNRAPTRRS